MELPGDAVGDPVYSYAEVLLLFGDNEEGLARLRTAASRAYCRVAAEVPLKGGAARFDQQIRCTAAILSATEPSPDFNALLDRLIAAGRAGQMNSIVHIPFDMVDDFFAADPPAQVDLLVDPTDVAIQDAMVLATEPTSARLHDTGKHGGSLLHQLSEEAARLASVLAALSEGEAPADAERGDEAAAAIDANFVRGIIRARRMRDQFFQSELFADPGFDMLLDLYAAKLEGSRVAVSSLCIAAAVPATTALRWIRTLTDKGMFVRSADPEDGRRIYISLSDDSARAMGRYLSAIQKSALPAV